MASPVERILAEAMTLSESERSDMAARLIASLDAPFDESVDRARRDEIEQRIDDMEAGRGESLSWPEVRQQILRRRDDSAAA